MSYLIGIFCAVLVITVCIAFHEFGHFLLAKFFHIGVVEYAVGMGPAFWQKRLGETVYSVRAIPFGGYCALYGEESAEASDKGLQEEGDKKRKHFRFVKPADYKTDWTSDRKLLSKPFWQKMIVYVAGPFFNIVLGTVASFILLCCFTDIGHMMVESVEPGSYAAATAIQPGDVIVGINGRETELWSDFAEYKSTHPRDIANGYDIQILRDGEYLTIRAHDDEEGMFGITLTFDKIERTPQVVWKYGWQTVRYMFRIVGDSLYMLFTGQAGLDDMSGFVGITAMISSSIEDAQSIGASIAGVFFYMLAMLSINLGLVNMLPLLALDGGRFLLCLFEGIFRRNVPPKIEYAINMVGMSALMVLLIYITYHDIVKIMNGFF